MIVLGGPEPTVTVPASTQAAQTAQAQLTLATAQAGQEGRFALQLTQDQLTSLLQAQLAKRKDVPLKEPMVLLHPDVIEIYGKIQQGNVLMNAKIVVKVSINERGKPQFEITEAFVGPIPLPEPVRQSIAAALNEAYLGAVGPVATGLRLERIVIEEGVITLIGRVK